MIAKTVLAYLSPAAEHAGITPCAGRKLQISTGLGASLPRIP